MNDNVYEVKSIGEILGDNTYPGRGIIIGTSADKKSAVAAYFIMGRSENSRNRVFCEKGKDEVIIYPFDASKVEDPSLIIYSPVKKASKCLIVTNGDQTDTVYDYITAGKSFEQALETRAFEPDAPNFTPRISGIINFNDNGFTYKMSILKSADPLGTACDRYTFSYNPVPGVGQFIHTYNHDGNPIPTFTGEPERVALPDSAAELAELIWGSLNEKNKISLYVRYTDIKTGDASAVLINKNKADA